MLGKSIIGHVFCYQKPFISFSTATNQIHQSLVPNLPNPSRLRLSRSKSSDPTQKPKTQYQRKFLKEQTPNIFSLLFFILCNQTQCINWKWYSGFPHHKLLSIRPRQLGEALDSNQAITVEFPSVNNIGSFLAALGDYVVAAEAVGSLAKLAEAVFLKCGNLMLLITLISISFQTKYPQNISK